MQIVDSHSSGDCPHSDPLCICLFRNTKIAHSYLALPSTSRHLTNWEKNKIKSLKINLLKHLKRVGIDTTAADMRNHSSRLISRASRSLNSFQKNPLVGLLLGPKSLTRISDDAYMGWPRDGGSRKKISLTVKDKKFSEYRLPAAAGVWHCRASSKFLFSSNGNEWVLPMGRSRFPRTRSSLKRSTYQQKHFSRFPLNIRGDETLQSGQIFLPFLFFVFSPRDFVPPPTLSW